MQYKVTTQKPYKICIFLPFTAITKSGIQIDHKHTHKLQIKHFYVQNYKDGDIENCQLLGSGNVCNRNYA